MGVAAAAAGETQPLHLNLLNSIHLHSSALSSGRFRLITKPFCLVTNPADKPNIGCINALLKSRVKPKNVKIPRGTRTRRRNRRNSSLTDGS